MSRPGDQQVWSTANGGGVGSRRNTPTEKHNREADEESDGTEGRLTLLWERRGYEALLEKLKTKQKEKK